MRNKTVSSALTLALGLGSTQASAVPELYQSSSDFFDDLSALGLVSDIHGFDAMTPGPIPSGGTADGITFEYALSGGRSLSVNDSGAVPTRSENNELGADAGFQGALVDGDGFDMSFAATHAFGLFVQADEDDIFADDFTLSFAGEVVGNLGDGEESLDPNTQLFFLGIIDADNVWSTASLESFFATGSSYFFTVDDIVTAAVPIPATFGLLGLGLVPLARSRRQG